MPTFTSQWLRDYEARRACSPQPCPKSDPVHPRESDLHSQVIEECRRRQWIVLHGSMAHPTHRTAGEFDFIILADLGRVLLVEAKSKTGKLSPPQQALHHWAHRLGHTPLVVRSFQEFLDLVS